ncbi:MAG TPA: SET domain-containing protein-lysine N-methyltransferase [Candidatus Paceibacterota bacterium]|nr:SET domain-containing protein-lysine N-methyltransferase [Candidatus Paceibacterota bacterium]
MQKVRVDNRFEIRDAGCEKGGGLFALMPIKKGEFILEYTGEKIPARAADESGSRYLFEINKNWTIDGSGMDNKARWINHSCDPNCEASIEKGHILINACKDIMKGEELTFDYGDDYFDEFIRPIGCRCGSANCRAPQMS